MKSRSYALLIGLMVCGLGLVSSSAALAQPTYFVTLDTSALQTAATGPYALDFQFTDGSGTGDANNTVVLSGFRFGPAGSASGSPTLTGGASGSLSSGFTLTDSAFFNEALQGFTPGDQLSFLVSWSPQADAGGAPDEFSLGLLDKSGGEIPTTGPGDALLVVDLNSANPLIQTYGADASRTSLGLGAPIVTAAPEPSSLALLVTLTGLCGPLGLYSCFRGRKAPPFPGTTKRLRHAMSCEPLGH